VRLRRVSHAVIVIAVLAAVACSVTTQDGVKHLVDTLSLGPSAANGVWLAFAFLVLLIAADNLPGLHAADLSVRPPPLFLGVQPPRRGISLLLLSAPPSRMIETVNKPDAQKNWTDDFHNRQQAHPLNGVQHVAAPFRDQR